MKIPVRWRDQDAQGWCTHTAILDMIAEARIDLLDGAVRKSGAKIDHVLASIEAQFIKPIHYPAWVDVEPRVKLIGNKSVTTEFTLRFNGEVAAKAKCVNVFFRDGGTVPIPSEVRKILTGV